MKVHEGASRPAFLSPEPPPLPALRCYLVVYPGGARCWPEPHRTFAYGFAKAMGGVVIRMVPEFPDAADKVRRNAFAPTVPIPLE